MSSFVHVRSVAVSPCHKAEALTSNVMISGGLFFVPIQVNALMTFDEYNLDITIDADTWQLRLAIYRQVDRIESAGTIAVQVAGTELLTSGMTAGNYTTFALSGPMTLLPGSYWIVAEPYRTSSDTGGRFTSNHGIGAGLLKMRWLRGNGTGGSTLASSYGGVNGVVGDVLYANGVGTHDTIWAALRYTGDAMP